MSSRLFGNLLGSFPFSKVLFRCFFNWKRVFFFHFIYCTFPKYVYGSGHGICFPQRYKLLLFIYFLWNSFLVAAELLLWVLIGFSNIAVISSNRCQAFSSLLTHYNSNPYTKQTNCTEEDTSKISVYKYIYSYVYIHTVYT